MNWHDFIICFFSGAFAANAVPHFVYGIAGDRFPTPFAHPPGKGLSSPRVNVLWALCNIVACYALFHIGHVWDGGLAAHASFFAGVALLGIFSSGHFAQRQR
ncbi:MAG: hypothetical protein KGQ70_07285 [Alphaproteobacteria bacterium]|nr:hypothetical protein [Alphaproteobacteria bacterium]